MTHAFHSDPARGVFTTTLVVEGTPVALDAHLERLAASVRALYGAPLPAGVPSQARGAARDLPLGALRLAAVPARPSSVRVDVTTRTVSRTSVLPGWEAALGLRTVVVDAWRGCHKWVDRRLLDRLDALASPADALLVDRDRGVLETTRGSVFALGDDGILRTPPLDGAILPGVTRAWAIELARGRCGVEVVEAPLGVDTLQAAREAFATGSLRGIEPVRAVDEAALPGPGELWRTLRSELARRWSLGAPPAARRR